MVCKDHKITALDPAREVLRMATQTFSYVQYLGSIAPRYRDIRRANPSIPAWHVLDYLKTEPGIIFGQFICTHEFAIIEDSDQCYCLSCGLDGDA